MVEIRPGCPTWLDAVLEESRPKPQDHTGELVDIAVDGVERAEGALLDLYTLLMQRPQGDPLRVHGGNLHGEVVGLRMALRELAARLRAEAQRGGVHE